MVAIYSWILLGVFAAQGGGFASKQLHLQHNPIGIILSIPWFQIVKIILIYAWLKVANIVRNPFGFNKGNDINLEKMLDFNIWKASVSIKHMDNPIYLQ